MKKWLAVLMAGMMGLSLAACSSDTSSGEAEQAPAQQEAAPAQEETAPAQEESASGDKLVLGYSQIGAESEWRTACTNSVKAAAEEYGIELKFSDAQQKQENQMKAIRTFIQQGVDVIAFTPVVSTGWDAVLQECKDAGIPTICVDRTIDADPDLYTCYIGSNLKEEGVRAANWLAKYLEEKGMQDDKIVIVELFGTVGSAAATDRNVGFLEVAGAHSNWEIKYSQTGNFTRAEGKTVMEAFLKSDTNNEINVLFAHNDDMAIGAIQAIEEAGRKPGEDIIVVSVDAIKGAFEAIMEGKLNATIECNPLLGPQIMETAQKLANDESVEKIVYSIEEDFDATNAAAAYPSRRY